MQDKALGLQPAVGPKRRMGFEWLHMHRGMCSRPWAPCAHLQGGREEGAVVALRKWTPSFASGHLPLSNQHALKGMSPAGPLTAQEASTL